MKRVWHHPEEPHTGKRYWRNLGELHDTPEFREWVGREFPQGAAELSGPEESEVTRRNFLKLMGAATSLAGFGMAACRRPEALLVPYAESVEWIIPGRPLLFATAMPRLGGCSPLVAKTHEGRPVHVTGNRLHPANANGLDGIAQASILDLYDPERSKSFRHHGETVSRHEFETAMAEIKRALGESGGERAAFLVGESTSPTRGRLLGELAEKYPSATFYRYEPVNLDTVRTAARAAFGEGATLVPKLENAKRILTLDCDFIGLDQVATNGAGDFMKNREPDDGMARDMNRLYTVEGNYTLTGGMADHRLRANVSQIPAVAALLAREFGAGADATFQGEPVKDARTLAFVAEAAKDLAAHKGSALVLAGTAQPPVVHLLAAAINQALDSFGNTLVVATADPDPVAFGSLAELVTAIGEKKVETLFITTDADPGYDAPADLDWDAAQRTVTTTVHLNCRQLTSTARAATWHVPGTHYLESWGDVRAADGTYSVVQPMILPLYGGISEIDLFLNLLADPSSEPAAPTNQETAPAAQPDPATNPNGTTESTAAAGAAGATAADAGATAAEAGATAAPAEAEATAAAAGAEAGQPAATAAAGEAGAPPAGAGAGAEEPGAAPQPPADDAATSPAYEAVRATFAGLADDDVETAWNLTLRDGFLKGSSYPEASAGFNASGASEAVSQFEPVPAPTRTSLEIVFRPDSKVWDGRYISNGWLQEVPDPVTKLTWDNAAQISLRTARDLDIEHDGDLIAIEVAGTVAHFPVIQVPGHADNALTIPLGYGQPVGEDHGHAFGPGNVGTHCGFNAYPLRRSSNLLVTSGARASLTGEEVEVNGRAVGPRYPLATTAEHQNMYGRALVREGTVERLEENPDFARTEGMDSHLPPNISLYKPEGRDGEPLINDPYHQWGMTIDLNRCIGCTACTLACQSENNIPIVGKEQVLIDREMHWIRMDRYFATPEPKLDAKTQATDKTNAWMPMAADHFDEPEMLFQPVACQHCELAPCETVCPVNATVHTEEGLNAMAYNRCIGTRYCANNCPYKVRRFNFFDYNKRPLDQLYRGPFSTASKTGLRQSLQLQKNPNVSVRMRGVMEKCTYCVQRIQETKIAQRRVARGSDQKRVPTNAVQTACQEACPSEAIVFGNLLNPDDDVTKRKASPRAYDLLNYLGVRPRTSYLARIKNPNPAFEAHPLLARGVGEISAHIH